MREKGVRGMRAIVNHQLTRNALRGEGEKNG
jgi:hypothetical protein